jgi:aminoglycoside phosphotransferase (APT) family kinase protein
MNTDELGSGIVEISRKARFADTSLDEWAARLKQLVSAQTEVIGSVEIANVRPVGTAAGGSNGTLLFDCAYETSEGPVSKALVLRFLPAKGLFHRYNVREQFELQRALGNTDVPVPQQLWLDETGEYLIRPGYVMAQVEGVTTPMTWMTSGLIFNASIADRRTMSLNYVHSLARIHSVDWKETGLQWLENRATGSRPVEREVNWYWDALLWSKADDHIRELSPIRDWLIINEPSDVDIVLCHGDANFGNYLYEGTDVSAVLDWEMAFLGTPECDLSFLKLGDGILQSEVPWPEGVLTHAEMRVEYELISGRPLLHMDYFELFTSYRLAVINVLAMQHFPPEVLAAYLPILERGPKLCLERARDMNIALTN